ncbi:MAG: transcriptional repressor LexA [Coriobacteriia bacterium]|nr:transcriptional repressor LexA [Coriobacteriia bacterium]
MADTGRPLSNKQQEVYDYVLAQTRAKGYPPTVREIMAGLNKTSTSTIHTHLHALEARGYLKRDPNKPRALEFPRERFNVSQAAAPQVPIEIIELPLIGQVAAGAPILAEENIVDTIPCPSALVRGASFLLKVKGDSMSEAGIFDGDLIIVRQQQTADNGEIVVALIEGEATVKRYYREGSTIRLQPENDAYEPIIITDGDFSIAGVAKGLIRAKL